MFLITGGLGFIGSHLAEYYINEGKEVTIVSRSKDKLKNIGKFTKDINLELADVTDFDAMEEIIKKYRPEKFFHLAGQITSYESFEYPMYDVEVNAKSTISILNSIKKYALNCTFVLGSTFWVVGQPNELPVTEETCCNPMNVYAANRLASENYCKMYTNVYGLDTRVVRLTNAYGARQQNDNPKKAAINYLIYRGYKGMDITLYNNGNFFRDLIYGTDAAQGIKVAADKGKPGETYFIGSGEKTWFHELGKCIQELTGARVVGIDETDFHKKIGIGDFVVDNSKMKQLGWNPQVGLREGVKKTLEYYKSLESQ